MKFTQTNVNKLRAPEGCADFIIFDEAMPGFGVRFRNGGAGTYMVQTERNGRSARVSIGKVSQLTLEDAKTEARKHFLTVAEGKNPHDERAKEALRIGFPFGEKVEEYCKRLEELGRNQAYVDDHRRCLIRYMPTLQKKGLGEITRALIAEQLDRIEKDSGRRQAGLARCYMHTFFSWCLTKGWVEGNPAMGTEKRPSKRRARVLKPEELVAIWNACDSDDHYDKIVRLLILLPLRITQIGSLNRKTELNMVDGLLDFEPSHIRAERGEDDEDDGKTKNGERFWMPVSAPAKAILDTMPVRNSSDFVFGTGEGGFSGWSACKGRLDERLGKSVGRWVHHDLRRTFDSLGVDKVKIAPWLTDVCLHHVGEHKKGVKRSYNYAAYIDEKREAVTAWGDYVLGLVAAARPQEFSKAA